MEKKRLKAAALLLIIALLFASCARNGTEAPAGTPASETQEEMEEPSEETVEETAEEEPEDVFLEPASSSLTPDGKWLTAVNETYANPAGRNESPALAFNAIPGAGCYAVYMIDISASNWVHWIARNLTVTELAQGASLEDSDYVGPYPPSGTHTYEIRIYALAAEPDSYPGTVNGTLSSAEEIDAALDISGGESGNILDFAVLSGTVESGGASVE